MEIRATLRRRARQRENPRRGQHGDGPARRRACAPRESSADRWRLSRCACCSRNSGRIDPKLRIFEKDFSPIVIFSTTRMPARTRAALAPKADLWLHESRGGQSRGHARHAARRLWREAPRLRRRRAGLPRRCSPPSLVDEIHITLCPAHLRRPRSAHAHRRRRAIFFRIRSTAPCANGGRSRANVSSATGCDQGVALKAGKDSTLPESPPTVRRPCTKAIRSLSARPVSGSSKQSAISRAGPSSCRIIAAAFHRPSQ